MSEIDRLTPPEVLAENLLRNMLQAYRAESILHAARVRARNLFPEGTPAEEIRRFIEEDCQCLTLAEENQIPDV